MSDRLITLLVHRDEGNRVIKHLTVSLRAATLVAAMALVGTSLVASTTFASSVSTKGSQIAIHVPVTGSGGFNYTQGSYLEGFEFTVNRTISVTKLGAYDSNLSKLPGGFEKFASVPVALYDLTSKSLLRSAIVSGSNPANGVYRYATLAHPVRLTSHATYAVVWVSLTNHYIASPQLVASDVNLAINYVAMASYGPGGLSTTKTMVEPNWFFTKSAHGMSAINYDLGPNFIFTLSQ